MERTIDEVPRAESSHTGARTYLYVWIALVILTILTVIAADMNFRRITIIVCLAIASVKSLLVLLYFMHLRYEKRQAIKLIIPVALCAVAIFIGLTFSDVFTR